jgi:lipoate-protein ligase B
MIFMLSIVRLTPWGNVSYEQALELQLKLSREAKAGWILFSPPPTITLGRRGLLKDILIPAHELAKVNARVLRVDRGGEVTYHGPGQIIAFPFGTLEQHVGDSRAVRVFVDQVESMIKAFAEYCAVRFKIGAQWRVVAERPNEGAGVWVKDEKGQVSKLASLGFGFKRESIRHGFALNVQPLQTEFSWINPCGEKQGRSASLFAENVNSDVFDSVVSELEEFLKRKG